MRTPFSTLEKCLLAGIIVALGLAGGRAARLIAERQAAVEPTEGLRDPIYTLRELGWPSTHFSRWNPSGYCLRVFLW